MSKTTKLTVGGKGAISDNLKSYFGRLSPIQQKDSFREMVKSMCPNAQVQAIEFSDLKNPRLPFEATAISEVRDSREKTKEIFSWSNNALPVVSALTNLHNLPLPEDRRDDYVLGFRFILVDEMLYPPPAKDFRPVIIPVEQSLNTPLVSFHAKCTTEGDCVRVRYEFTLKQDRIAKKDYKELCETMQDVLKKSQMQIVFKKQKVDERENTLKDAVEKGPQDKTALLNLAKHYLTKGKYTEARDLLEKAVIIDSKDGEVHYFLGIALGYLDQYDRAKKEFEKAKEWTSLKVICCLVLLW